MAPWRAMVPFANSARASCPWNVPGLIFRGSNKPPVPCTCFHALFSGPKPESKKRVAPDSLPHRSNSMKQTVLWALMVSWLRSTVSLVSPVPSQASNEVVQCRLWSESHIAWDTAGFERTQDKIDINDEVVSETCSYCFANGAATNADRTKNLASIWCTQDMLQVWWCTICGLARRTARRCRTGSIAQPLMAARDTASGADGNIHECWTCGWAWSVSALTVQGGGRPTPPGWPDTDTDSRGHPIE